MRFGEAYINELKSRIRPSDVIGRHVKLKRQGREFAGLSPFTNEKTPSFFVNDDKGFFHCFSSGKHGDIINFLMEVEGLEFPEAVENLANMAGMELPREDPEAERKAARNKVAVDWMERVQNFFAHALRADIGQSARAYLTSRGLGPEDWARFGIGYAPDSFSSLRDSLSADGAPLEVLINTGMVIKPDDPSRQPWDRFRHRIMFPIRDPRGRLVAFGGRALSKDDKAKYLNSPETDIFHKGRVLYHYPDARKALSDPKNKARGMIVAEGYMDVVALARAGFEHAVAPLGTALTEEQLELLWRAGPEPTLCFDGDSAGLRAAYRSVERALPLIAPGKSLRFAPMPEGLDPDDLIRERGKSAMAEQLEAAIPLIDMLWEREVRAEPLLTPEDKAGLKSRLMKACYEIVHEDVRAQYRTELLSRFNAAYGYQSQTKTRRGPRVQAQYLDAEAKSNMQSEALRDAREMRIIGAIVLWPELLSVVDETFFALEFINPAHVRLQKCILHYIQTTKEVDKNSLNAHIQNSGQDKDLRKLHHNRVLIGAGMGGSDADLKTRLALWQAEAAALRAVSQVQSARKDAQSRIADFIREDNVDAHKQAARASWFNRT